VPDNDRNRVFAAWTRLSEFVIAQLAEGAFAQSFITPPFTFD
jgi:hypothetical protein